MSTFAETTLVAANTAYQKGFGSKGSLPLPPGKKLAILTCMDARIDTGAAFGIKEGDSHVIRNAGGRASDALRSLIISQELLGTREIIVAHHTGCGMETFTSPQAAGLLKKHIDHKHHPAIDAIAFLELPSVYESIKEDVAFLANHPLIHPDTKISGFVYQVETGKLEKIV